MRPHFLANTDTTKADQANPQHVGHRIVSMLNSSDAEIAYLLASQVEERRHSDAPASQQTPATALEEICNWVRKDPKRELRLIVGLRKNGESADYLQAAKACAAHLAWLLHTTVREGALRCKAYGIWGWHTNAFFLANREAAFGRIKAAIFGSTNFSGNPVNAGNFKLDLCLFPENQKEHENPEYLRLLRNLSAEMNQMYVEALDPNNRHPSIQRPFSEVDFHAWVKNDFDSLKAGIRLPDNAMAPTLIP